MARHYSNPKRADDPYALPDVETFRVTARTDTGLCPCDGRRYEEGVTTPNSHGPQCYGWYWQACFPGCLPGSDPVGPFATEADALADARDGVCDDDESEGNDGE